MTQKISDTFVLQQLDGSERAIFMSYGLLDELCRLADDVSQVPHLAIDHELRWAVMDAVTAERTPKGRRVKKDDDAPDSEVGISPDQAIELVSWAQAHVMDFFLKVLGRLKGLKDVAEPALQQLLPSSSNGSIPSALSTDSAGPSA